MKYLCHTNWILDGTLICVKGKEYEIVNAEDDNEYCDVLNCEDGKTVNTNRLEVDEYFNI